MRVLHITSGNMYGGVETFLATLARESAAAPEMDSEFAVCFEGRCSQELAVLGHAPHRLGDVRLSRPHSVLRARRALAVLLRRTRYDVVVCHQPWTYVVFGSVARRAKRPVALWVHMAGEGRHWLERLARRVRPDIAICNSQFSASQLSRWLTDAPVEPVYYPVSASAASSVGARDRVAMRRTNHTLDSDVVIVQVSRLEPWKGQHVLLEALTELRSLSGWTCWIVGGAQRPVEVTYRQQLEALARRGGIDDRVHFLGQRADVPALLAAADVFCQPNTAPEPFGLSLVEALQAGLPVVTSGVGGACEIVDASCGVLTPTGDKSALAAALKQLVIDRELRARLGTAARLRPAVLCDATRQMRRIHHVLSSVAAA
jgi:glycosyltransferase involved in cell wall biosynthesis